MLEHNHHQQQHNEVFQLIQEWNASRLDMFAVSQPDENFEFCGIVRFFFQEPGEKCATKCVRLSSQTTAAQCVELLVEKFRADLRMLSCAPVFSLWEVHDDGEEGEEERRLCPDERPLLVQLHWGKLDRDGRFVLRREGKEEEKKKMETDAEGGKRQQNQRECFARNQQKRFSKNAGGKKQRRQQQQFRPDRDYGSVGRCTQSLFKEELPETTFTRTISNPELVMKRRREQKLENRLKQLDNNGGSLKIYGVDLFPDRPYVTLLVGVDYTARQIVQMALEKYGLESQNPEGFSLVEIFLTEPESNSRSFTDLRGVEKQRERLLQDEECPLRLLAQQRDYANVVFFLRRKSFNWIMPMTKSLTLDAPAIGLSSSQWRTALGEEVEWAKSIKRRHYFAGALETAADGGEGGDDQNYQQQQQGCHSQQHNSTGEQINNNAAEEEKQKVTNCGVPCLVPVNAFANTANFGAGAMAIQPGITEIGSSSSCSIQLRAPSVLPRHCSLLFRPGPCPRRHQLWVTLLDPAALVEVNGVPVSRSASAAQLNDGILLRIGGVYCYRYFGAFQNQQQSAVPNPTIEPSAVQLSHRPTLPSFANFSASLASQDSSSGYVAFDFDRARLPVPHHQSQPCSSVAAGQLQHQQLPSASASTMMTAALMPHQHQPNSNCGGGGSSSSAVFPAFDAGHGQSSRPQFPPSLLAIQQHRRQHRNLPILLECLDSQREDDLLRLELFGAERDCHQLSLGQRFGAFRLTPAFVLYALCRHRLAHCAWDVQHRLNQHTLAKFIDICLRTVKAHLGTRDLLVFWLANSSELLNMIRSDGELSQSVGSHLIAELGHMVQTIFNLFVECCRQSTFAGIQSALNLAQLTNPNNNAIQSAALLASLDECIRSVRWALLNPALTIQLFSQLFHFIASTLFNWLVLAPEARPFLCLSFGIRLKQLLQQIHQWAQQQGLELAAECHMDRLAQTVNLLVTPKTLDQVAALGATCYKLNSIQVRYLLENYSGDPRVGESPTVPQEVVKHVVALATQQNDQMAAQKSAASISIQQLADSTTLQLPFLLPQDGYVIEKLRGIPSDMAAFVNGLQQKGFVRVLVHQGSVAEMSWTVFLASSARVNQQQQRSRTPSSNITMFPPTVPPPPPHHQIPQQRQQMGQPRPVAESPAMYAEVQRRPTSASILAATSALPSSPSTNGSSPSSLQHSHPSHQQQQQHQQWNERLIDADGQRQMLVQRITIRRQTINQGIGLSIVEVTSPAGHGGGIYVKSVIPDSAAHMDGRIAKGDQLLSVNGQSLLGVGQEIAAQKIVSAGPIVHLEVAKKAAQLNGIEAYFNQQQTDMTPNGNGHQQNGIVQTKQQQIIQKDNGTSEAVKQQMQPVSASEHHVRQNTSDSGSRASPNSTGAGLRNPVLCNVPPQLSQQSSSSTSSSLSSRLPSHYKPASVRPQHIVQVVQPARPQSSSPLAHRRSESSQYSVEDSHRNGTPVSHHFLDNNGFLRHSPANLANLQLKQQQHLNQRPPFCSPSQPLNVIPPPPSSANGLHHHGNNVMIGEYAPSAASPPIIASTTNSTGSTATVEQSEQWLLQQNNNFQANANQHPQQMRMLTVKDPIYAAASRPAVHPQKYLSSAAPAGGSGRLSAPLLGAEQQPVGQQNASAQELAVELEQELDRLDSEGAQMSEADQKRYRELLDRQSQIRRESSEKRGVKVGGDDGHTAKLPPSMMAAARHLERQSKSLAALSLDPANPLSNSSNGGRPLLASAKSKSTSDTCETLRAAFPAATDEQQQTQQRAVFPSINGNGGEIPAVSTTVKKPSPPAVPAKPALREMPCRSSPAESVNPRKRVQFSSPANSENSDPITEQQQLEEAEQYLEEEEEPRVQIVGANEVYVNDPRQKRLEEMQQASQQQKVLRQVDSSALGFREKMRMFADQLGEREESLSLRAINHHKNSSAERLIQRTLEADS